MAAIDSKISLFCLEEGAAVERDGDAVMDEIDRSSPFGILGAMRDGFASEPSLKQGRLESLTNYFTGPFKSKYLLHKSEKVRVKAMELLEAVWLEFVFGLLHAQTDPLGQQSGESVIQPDQLDHDRAMLPAASDADQTRDGLLTLLNDILLELFGKVKDVYCVVSSLKTQQAALATILADAQTVAAVVSSEFVTQLMTANSSPHLHVPQYNFKTREAAYKIFETVSVNKALAEKVEPSLFMSCVLSSIEGEADPRNLVTVFELINFMLLNFC